MHKRQFLKNLMLTSIGAPLGIAGLAKSFEKKAHLSPLALASDDAFWDEIRKQYLLKPDYINLENGYYNFLPQPLLNKYIDHIKEVNYQGSYYMRTVQFENKKNITTKLAKVAGCSPDQIIITRNTTESLDMVIGGLDWKAGDEAIMALQDYGAMLEMFDQIKNRYGVVNVMLSVPNHPKNDQEIIDLYKNAITPKTKAILVSHMINITGQILPIKEICTMAHEKGVQVIVDGAHAFAHIKYSIQDLGCDYYAASLHKWLSVPLGAGLLYVQKDNIKKVWPLLADSEKDPNKINRLNHTNRSCAIANIGIEGIEPGELAKRLLKEHNVFTVAIDYANVQGCRICPNVYTTTQELDSFVLAIKKLSNNA